MPRPATGSVVVTDTKHGRTYALRFSAYGQRRYITLGTADEGWDRRQADDELAGILRAVRLGTWRPPVDPGANPDPGFHEYASRWWEARSVEVQPITAAHYRWALVSHLLPRFERHTLTQITVAEVDSYRESKAAEKYLSASSINKTLLVLGMILDEAEEQELIARCPLRVNSRRRKMKAPRPYRSFLDRADQATALLDAAGELDREARGRYRNIARRTMLTTLVLTGVRASELCELRWRDIDLEARRVTIRSGKTAASARHIDLLPALHETLAAHRLDVIGQSTVVRLVRADDLVFPTLSGRKRTKDNLREHVLVPAIKRANARLAEQDRTPLPDGLSPHSLRRTYTAMLLELGENIFRVQQQLGHRSARLTQEVYAGAMDHSGGDRDAWAALAGLPQSANESGRPAGERTGDHA